LHKLAGGSLCAAGHSLQLQRLEAGDWPAKERHWHSESPTGRRAIYKCKWKWLSKSRTLRAAGEHFGERATLSYEHIDSRTEAQRQTERRTEALKSGQLVALVGGDSFWARWADMRAALGQRLGSEGWRWRRRLRLRQRLGDLGEGEEEEGEEEEEEVEAQVCCVRGRTKVEGPSCTESSSSPLLQVVFGRRV